jgi:ATP-dependent DNA helicase RecG
MFGIGIPDDGFTLTADAFGARADLVTYIEEGQFSDVKAAAISPSKLSHTISAFANTDGGDLYIGISENLIGGNVKIREWAGFAHVEAANGHIQSFEQLSAEQGFPV